MGSERKNKVTLQVQEYESLLNWTDRTNYKSPEIATKSKIDVELKELDQLLDTLYKPVVEPTAAKWMGIWNLLCLIQFWFGLFLCYLGLAFGHLLIVFIGILIVPSSIIWYKFEK